MKTNYCAKVLFILVVNISPIIQYGIFHILVFNKYVSLWTLFSRKIKKLRKHILNK